MITESQRADEWLYKNFYRSYLINKYFPIRKYTLDLPDEDVIHIWKSETGLSGNLYTEEEVIQLMSQMSLEQKKNGYGGHSTTCGFAKCFFLENHEKICK